MRVFSHDELPSTNSEAARLSTELDGWAVVTARAQSAGRGRQGRVWTSPPGNLHASFLVPRDRREGWRAPWLLGFVVALAVADAIAAELPPEAAPRLKWPNDVLVGGAKVAGLLLETTPEARHVVAGVGVNIAHAPPDTPYPATTLNAHAAAPVPVDRLLGALTGLLPARVEQWLELGFPAIREELRARGHQPGEALAVRTDSAGNRVEGRFVDIDPDGRLVLATGAGERRFAAGDVFPL